MQTREVLDALRGAAQALSSSQPTTATATGGAGPLPLPPQPAPSASHMLLQISALHKAFLALSDAFTEEMTQRQAEQEEQRGALQSVRRECAGKLQLAAALQAEVQQLAAADGQQAHSIGVLAQRCTQLEQEVDRLGQELEEQQYGAGEALQAAVERAVARQLAAAHQQWLEQQLPALAAAAAERAVQGWAAQALPPLLQPMQEAVAATAELAASLASDMATLAGQAEQLRTSHQNHEQRLAHAEERGMAAANSSAADASVALQHLQQQVHAVQAGHSRLDETLQHIKQRQQEQEQQIEQQRQQQQQQWAGASQGGGSGEEQLQQQLQGALQELDSLSLAAAELPAVQQQLAAVAEQQAQQARSSQDLVQSVIADVRALARHTKALDKEVRGLAAVTKQTQQALLQSCSVFSRALGCPSPVGPFTSFPPQL